MERVALMERDYWWNGDPLQLLSPQLRKELQEIFGEVPEGRLNCTGHDHDDEDDDFIVDD